MSGEVLHLMVEAAARKVARPEFARVTRFHGFSSSLAHTIDEFASAGCESARLAGCLPECPLGESFLAVYREVEGALARRGLATRARRLETAAARIEERGLDGITTIFLDGFHALPDPELRVVAALGRHAEVTLTLGDEDLSVVLRARLNALGFVEERGRPRRPRPAVMVVKAPDVTREVEEIARRILVQAEAGRAFREIGIIVRSQENYVPALRSTLERFQIPARFYFDARLEHHPAVRFLAGAVDAMLGGWDHGRTLAALRLTPRFADFDPVDAFDFDVRAQVPNAGLSELRALLLRDEGQARPGAERLLRKLESIAALEEWRSFALTPADWAARAATLRHLFRPAPPAEPATHAMALEWRSQAAALDAFCQALADAAAAFDPARQIALEDYWRSVKSVLRLKPLRLEDERRNVVHVMSTHEARQWVLPVVFVCGMVERQFPQVHRQDPFFPDAARTRLNAAGIRVRTAAESEREEQALFDTATSRATMLVTLTYPEYDARGDRNLPSVYLEDVLGAREDSVAVRPVPRRLPAAPAAPGIAAAELLAYLRRKTARLSPSAIESFLQCPFQYFAQRLLRLEAAPERPEQRLSALEQGNVVHDVLKEWWQDPRDVTARFERVFTRCLDELHIPNGYQTERLRNAMLDDLKRFTSLDPWPRAAFDSHTEMDFAFPLEEGLEIFGRIDRLDVAPDGRAFVLDYKYSGKASVNKKLTDENLMQAPLYLMAARHLKFQPAGMFYVGLKGGVEYVGWSDAPLMDAEPLPENWLEDARGRALRVVEAIRGGAVEPAPADRDKCRYCDARDVCRMEVPETAAMEEGA